MDDAKIIELVMQKECIYNKYNAGYKNIENKRKIWETIALEMGATADQCIRRWTSLRDRYVRECKRLDAPSGSGASNERLWPHFETMQFLKAHIGARPTRGNISLLSTASEITTGTSETLEPFLVSTPLSSPTESESISRSENWSSSSSRSKRRRCDDTDKEFSEAVRAFKNLCETRQQQLNKADPAVQSFGQTLVNIISGMPEQQKARAMKEAMDAVIDVQLEGSIV